MHHNPPRRRSCLPYLNKIHNQINRKSRIRLYILRGGRQKGDHLWIQRKSGIMFSWGFGTSIVLAHPERPAHGGSSLNRNEIRNYVFHGCWAATNYEAKALAIYQGLVPLENRGIKQMRHGRFYIIIHHMHCRQHIHLARPIHR